MVKRFDHMIQGDLSGQDGVWTGEAVFVDDVLFSVRNGGFVQTPGSRSYRSLFNARNLISGAEVELSLTVPFDGYITPPSTNRSYTKHDDGTESWTSYASLPLSIAGLEVRGNMLVIFLENQDQQQSLEFELKPLVSAIGSRKAH